MRLYSKTLLLGVLMLLFFGASLLAQSSRTLEKTLIDGREFYVYEVSASEGFYALTRRFGVTQAEIEKYNPETRAGLKVGQRLLIPAVATSGSTTETSDQSSWFTHTVSTGETLSSVARMYDTTVKAIRALNPSIDEQLIAGHAIRVPQTAAGSDHTFHTIESKETLFSLSRRSGVTMQSIMDANPGLTSASFTTGRVVRIPATNASNALAQTAAPSATSVATTRYRVRKKETLYSVARSHNITVTRLMELNPGVTSLKEGNYVNVPAAEVQSATSQQNGPSLATIQEMNDMLEEASAVSPASQIKVAILLPLDASNVSASKQNRYLEFYEGFLLAADSIRRQGVSMDIYTFDTSSESLSAILVNSVMNSVDLIIGPADNTQIARVAQFADKKGINMVNPFTFDSDATASYPRLFQLNTPNSYLYAESAAEFVKLFGSNNIVFLSEEGTSADKKEFVDYLRLELSRRNIAAYDFSYSNVEQVEHADSILALPKMKTVYVPTSSKREVISKLAPVLRRMQADSSKSPISLFGYPEWQMYTNELMDTFYELDTYIYTRIYLNPFASDVKHFYSNYKYWYQKDLMSLYPRYGVLGFDTGLFFLQAVKRYGRQFDNHIDQHSVHSLQTAMCFKRVNTWSGFVNRSIYFVNFRPNNTITKIEVK